PRACRDRRGSARRHARAPGAAPAPRPAHRLLGLPSRALRPRRARALSWLWSSASWAGPYDRHIRPTTPVPATRPPHAAGFGNSSPRRITATSATGRSPLNDSPGCWMDSALLHRGRSEHPEHVGAAPALRGEEGVTRLLECERPSAGRGAPA